MYIAGDIIEGPSTVIYFSGQTPLPIEMVCNVTLIPSWRVNGTDYLLGSIASGNLQGHSRVGTNILINQPLNSTEYVCVESNSTNIVATSEPANLYFAGMYVQSALCAHIYIYIVTGYVLIYICIVTSVIIV